MSIALRNLQLQQRHPLQSSWVSFAIFRSTKDGLRYGLHACGTDGVRQGRDCRFHRYFMMATVSGGNDAFGKSFIRSVLLQSLIIELTRPETPSSLLSQLPEQQIVPWRWCRSAAA
jgi:hypothetical protein